MWNTPSSAPLSAADRWSAEPMRRRRVAAPLKVAAALMAAALLTNSCGEGEPSAETAEVPADSATTITDGNSSETSTTEPSGAGIAVEATGAANALLALLSEEEKATLSYDYGDSAIVSSWSNLPACDNNGRAGIRHGDLTGEQVDGVLAVADAVLSDEGSTEYRQIIAADEELGGGDGDVWDADCYYLAFFGEPSVTEPWALQFGGHHYARTVAFADGEATVTPAFTGVEPRSFSIDGAIVEPLADEAAAMFAIFESMTDDEFTLAELDGNIGEVLLGPGQDDNFPSSDGIAVAELSDETRALVLAAVRTWVDDFESGTADRIMAEIETGLDETVVGWANSIEHDTEDSYGRIDGPSIWIEFVNERGVGGDDIHVHSVYRDKNDDYGSAQ